MKKYEILLLATAIVQLLCGCQQDTEVDNSAIVNAPDSLIIDDRNYTLNGSILYGNNYETTAFAELVENNKLGISPLVQIDRLFLIWNEELTYTEAMPRRFAPVDDSKLVISGDNVPWRSVSQGGVEMVVELLVEDHRYYLKDPYLENR